MRRVSPVSATTWMSATVLRSRLSVRLETNAISRPSGENAGCASSHSPSVSRRGADPSAPTIQMCLWRSSSSPPSSDLYRARVYTRTRSSSSAESFGSRTTNASERPSGDHARSEQSSPKRVSWRASPPSRSSTKTFRGGRFLPFGTSPRSDVKARCSPSGDHSGVESCDVPAVICARASVPSDDTSQIAPWYPSRLAFAVLTEYAIRVPSGEICASVRKRNSYKSSDERGRGDEDNAAYRAIYGPVRPARTHRDARRCTGDVLRPRRRVPPQHGRNAIRRRQPRPGDHRRASGIHLDPAHRGAAP